MNWKERAIRQIFFECKRCGTCCQEPKIVDIYPRDALRIARRFRISMRLAAKRHFMRHPKDDNRMMLKNVTPCEFYENGCRIYRSRPLICRMYPYLAGPTIYCETPTGELPEMDDQDVIIKLAKVTNLRILELEDYLRYIGAWKDGRFTS